ncbi:hypothetical protein VNI00_003713 [Paramarasmius palmivorus]|uniref:Uncharacterized protein n=1 Tax=Paramarasmius palmivorus TaxID=297713 RepID=A0AAW0DT03_9AGAR
MIVGVVQETLGLLIQTFVDDIKDSLRAAALGDATLLSFTCNETIIRYIPDNVLQYIIGLGLPATHSIPNKPSFLLEGLECALEDQARDERYKQIFVKRIHRMIINTSGSGKTRAVLEALCQQWGFYFLCRREADGIGSDDLVAGIADLSSEPGLKDLPESADPDERDVISNRRIAAKHLSPVLLSRLVIFEAYIGIVAGLLTPDDALQPFIMRWLHLQLQPILLGRDDVFADLAHRIKQVDASPADISALIKLSTSNILEMLNQGLDGEKGVFIVLDEAQEACNQLQTTFRSNSLREPRPILRELVHLWSLELAPTSGTNNSQALVKVPFTFVVTGTGLSWRAMREALSSSTMKEDNIATFKQMGAFEHLSDQAGYIRKYVPTWILDTDVGRVLQDRMWYWLRGRYRFTAEFISTLLSFGLRRPNHVLNQYIKNFIGVYPSDCPETIIDEENRNMWPFTEISAGVQPIISYSALRWDTLRDNITALTSVYKLTWKYILSSDLDGYLGESRMDLVEYGFARIPRDRRATPIRGFPNPDNEDPLIDERLVLWACAIWLNTDRKVKNVYSLFQFLSERIRYSDNGHDYFEDFLLYYFILAFGSTNPRTLGEVFHILGPNATFLRQKCARLTSVYVPGHQRDQANRQTHYLPVVLSSSGEIQVTPGAIGLYAGEYQGRNVFRWMNHEGRELFCFPDKSMGPDLIFILELIGAPSTYIWVSVQAKQYNTASLSSETIQDAIRSVTPKAYFLNKVERAKVAEGIRDGDSYARNLLTRERLMALPQRDTEIAGEYSVLRVLATWPAVADLYKHFGIPQSDQEDYDLDDGFDGDDQHPVAFLNGDMFHKLITGVQGDQVLDRFEDHIAREASTKKELRARAKRHLEDMSGADKKVTPRRKATRSAKADTLGPGRSTRAAHSSGSTSVAAVQGSRRSKRLAERI